MKVKNSMRAIEHLPQANAERAFEAIRFIKSEFDYRNIEPTFIIMNHKLFYNIMSKAHNSLELLSDILVEPFGRVKLFGIPVLKTNDIQENEIIIV